MLRFIAGLPVVSVLFCGLAVAEALPDFEREARLRDEIVDVIFDGEPIDLTVGGRTFLAIDMAPDGDAKGAVVLLHGRGFHPNWDAVIKPLRIGLADDGWRTLSLQMPVLEKSAKYNDYVPVFPQAVERIEAALAYLRAEGVNTIVVLAHSCGFHMANHWLLNRPERHIDALIAIGAGATDYRQPQQEPFAFSQLDIPILDVYGERDYPAVLRKAATRQRGLNHPQSTQIAVTGSDHDHSDNHDALLRVVAEWLRTLNRS